jgi:hypothetical protein
MAREEGRHDLSGVAYRRGANTSRRECDSLRWYPGATPWLNLIVQKERSKFSRKFEILKRVVTGELDVFPAYR